MSFDPHLSAGRRFAMLVAVALLLYSYKRTALTGTKDIQFFGLSFPVNSIELDVGFLALTTYALIRFIYLALIQTTPPWRTRRMLKQGILPQAFFLSNPPGQDAAVVDLQTQVQRYLPYEDVKICDKMSRKPLNLKVRITLDQQVTVVRPERSWSALNTWATLFWCGYENLHYSLPFLLSGVGVIWLIIQMSLHS